MAGFTAFVVAREYTGVVVVEGKDGGPSPSAAITKLVCRDCFGATVLLADFGDSILLSLTTKYKEGEDDVTGDFLDVHFRYFEDLCRRYVFGLK